MELKFQITFKMLCIYLYIFIYTNTYIFIYLLLKTLFFIIFCTILNKKTKPLHQQDHIGENNIFPFI